MSGVPAPVSFSFSVGSNLLRTQQVCLHVGLDLAGQDAGFLPLAGNPRPPGLYVGHNPALDGPIKHLLALVTQPNLRS